MAEYRVYRDFGEFGQEYACYAVSIRDCLSRIVKESKGGSACEFTVRLHGEWIATVNLDQFGNYRAEVLESRAFPIDVSYSVGSWASYWLNSDGEWIKGGCELYHACTGD